MYILRKLVRDASLIASIIGALLILFVLQSFLSERITGDAIQIGRPENQVIIIPPDNTPKQHVVVVDPKTQCWLNRGLRLEDIAVVGPLLQQTNCATSAPRQRIQATVDKNCLSIAVGGEAATELCLQNNQPSFSLEFPTPSTGEVVVPSTKPNYWLAFLILLLGISILFIWGRTDMHYDYYRRRAKEDFTRLLPGAEEVQIRYIKPPPAYLKKPGAYEEKHPVSVTVTTPQPELVKPSEQKRQPPIVKQHITEQQRTLSSPLNKALVKFNALSQTLCDMIALKKFTEAEQQYPALYKLALDIYPQVSTENQPRLLRVVTSLHEQLQDVRKAYAVAQDVKDVYQKDLAKETPVQVWKPATLALPKEQVHHLDQELTRLRHMLEHTKPSDAAKHSKLRFWH